MIVKLSNVALPCTVWVDFCKLSNSLEQGQVSSSMSGNNVEMTEEGLRRQKGSNL